jgi:putative ABC transport system permease protein
MLGDIRYAVRTFAKRPSFAVAAVATLALGIAVNTIAFSLLNSLVFRPMPIPLAGRVARLYPVDAAGRRSNLFSYPDYLDYREASSLFETLAAYMPADLTAGRSSLDASVAVPRATLGYVVSAGYFDLTGVRPAVGRVLQPQDDRAGTQRVVLSHTFWQSRFGGDPGVVGGTMTLNGTPFTIVGVAVPGFAGTEPLVADVWIPLSALPIAVPGASPLSSRDGGALLVLGRLSPGVSRARAAEAMSVVAGRLAAAYPGTARPATVAVEPGTFFTLDPGARPIIAGVMGVVGLVLLIACANVANLMLAHAASRQREIAVRLAIGAARGRIIRQLTVEALMLSLAAGGAALLLSEWTLRALYRIGVALAPFPWTIALNLDPDVRVFAYTLALAAGGGLVLGLAPALQASSPDIVRALHIDGAVAGGRLPGTRLRHGLVILQVAGSLVLLVAAGLLVRGLQSARALDLGFRTEGVLYGEYDLRGAGYTTARADAFTAALAERARTVPGLRSVAFTSHVPLHGGVRRVTVRLLDHPAIAPVSTIASTVSAEYFETLGIRIVAGRRFSADDAGGAAPAVVISEGLARRFWPGEPAVGKALAASEWPAPRIVIGVARDASNGAIWREKEMAVYVPARRSTDARDLRLIVHTTGHESSAARALQAGAASLDPDLRFEAIPLDRLLGMWLLPSRVAAGAAGTLAAMALLLACVGLYGVLAFTVSQRMREIGVRMALGADARTVVALILGDGWRLAWKGLAAGAVCSLVTAPLLGRLLFDVSAFDPLTMAGVSVLLTLVAACACYLPARRAARLEPLSVLRVD